MKRLPPQPTIYEIDTWVWLDELSRESGSSLITLDQVPAPVWDEIASHGFDAVWLMGVWQRSPAGIEVARHNSSLVSSFREALADYSDDDVTGSPYCVRSYVVDNQLGGPEALAAARDALARRGLGLLLDYVPNHVAIDHPWATAHPDYFIEAPSDTEFDRDSYVMVDNRALALGRDPYFPAWPEVLQLNAFHPEIRTETARTLASIATQCDGVRCDMAMLLINDVFEKTWGDKAGPKPESDFWPDIISTTKSANPGFTFIAEAYWDLEWDLLRQGFDYCYDKRLYDRLLHEDARSVRSHLQAELSYQQHLLRFIENHDEPRVAATVTSDRARAAAITIALLPGAKLYHEGQFTGRRVHNPVLLGRRVNETIDAGLQSFYAKLLAFANTHKPGDDWQLCETRGWPDNNSHEMLLAWSWVVGAERYLVVVNFAPTSSQGLVQLPWLDATHASYLFDDVVGDKSFEHATESILDNGLYAGLGPWQAHVFHVHSR